MQKDLLKYLEGWAFHSELLRNLIPKSLETLGAMSTADFVARGLAPLAGSP